MTAEPAKRPRHRLRYRFHWSSIFGATLVFAAVVFFNVPGNRTRGAQYHGWPLVYLHREVPDPPPQPGVISCPITIIPDPWHLTEDVQVFSPALLAVDVAVAVGLALLAGAVMESVRRRFGPWLRFRLRTALAAMIVFALPFSWLERRIHTHRLQQPVIHRFEAIGCFTTYDSILPEWMRAWLSDDLGRPLDDIRLLHVYGETACDDDVRELHLLTTLRSLDLSGTKVTDAGLPPIARLTQLRWLKLGHTGVTDLGLVKLKHLDRLEYLGLDDTEILGPGLADLRTLPHLRWISLENCPLSDDGLMELAGCAALTSVDADGTFVTERGVVEFRTRSPETYVQADQRRLRSPPENNPFGP
jgi:hypothetical protein